jgi:DNA-binding IclR family transcriptional regulator
MSQRSPKPLSKPYSGTQAIVRASRILKAIGTSASRGLRVVDICGQLEIERPTVHRILSCLISEGLVVRDDHGKRYLLGEQLYRLGLLGASRLNLREICEIALTRIAAATGDSVFLATRRGDDALVIDRRIGTTPARTMPLDVGMPRPLGVGASGLAILGALPDREAQHFIENNALRLRQHNVRPEWLFLQIAKARKNGYAYSRGYGPPRLSGIGMPLRDGSNRCIGAISVTNVAECMTSEHRSSVLITLRDELAGVNKRLRLLNAKRPNFSIR